MRSVSVVRIKQVRDRTVRFAAERVTGPEQVYETVRGFYEGESREVLSALYLDTRGAPVCFHVLAVGGLNAANCRPAEVLQPALLSNAASMILVHNHPSGCAEPSPEDLAFTEAISRAGALLGLSLHDHLVLGDEAFVSLRERGLMPEAGKGSS